MLPPFIHSVVVPDQAISADGVFTFDIGTNPLSMLLIALRPLNNTGTLVDFVSYRNLCAAINRLAVLDRGEALVMGRGEDFAALNYFRWGMQPYQGQHDDTDDERRCAVLPIIMGRWPWSRTSCYPSRLRGELTLELDLDIADTGYDGLRISVEAVELPGATPKEFERKVAINQTWAATGQQFMDITPGKDYRGFLLFGTTGFAGATPAPSWGRVRVLRDNMEHGYAATDFEVAQMIHSLRGIHPPRYDAHRHRVTTDGNAQTALTTIGGEIDVGMGYNLYSFLDYDPLGDDSLMLKGGDAKRLQLVCEAETADAVRCIPFEVVRF